MNIINHYVLDVLSVKAGGFTAVYPFPNPKPGDVQRKPSGSEQQLITASNGAKVAILTKPNGMLQQIVSLPNGDKTHIRVSPRGIVNVRLYKAKPRGRKRTITSANAKG